MADQTDFRALWLISGVFIALIVVILFGWIWCWRNSNLCPFCTSCPDCPKGEICAEVGTTPDAQIVLEDTHSGVWMVLDSEFIDIPTSETTGSEQDSTYEHCSATSKTMVRSCTWPPYSTNYLAAGVLFQLGPAVDESGMGEDDHYEGVTITWGSGSATISGGVSETCSTTECTKTFDSSEFDWIDINPARAQCTIDSSNAYKLFGRKPPATNVVPSDCDSATISGGAPETCLRIRDLHGVLLPDDAITYWTDNRDFYAIKASNSTAGDGGEDIEYVFDLYEPVSVDVWLDGCLIQTFESATEIRIEYEGHSTHGKYHRPAMNG